MAKYDKTIFALQLKRTGHQPGALPRRGRPVKYHTEQERKAAHRQACATRARNKRKIHVQFCKENFGVADPDTVIKMMIDGRLEIPKRLTRAAGRDNIHKTAGYRSKTVMKRADKIPLQDLVCG